MGRDTPLPKGIYGIKNDSTNSLFKDFRKMTRYDVSIPVGTPENFTIELNTGTTVVFVGANGSGKTRLGCEIERQIRNVHRIPAHKSLAVPDSVSPKNLGDAMNELLTGHVRADNKIGHRYSNKPATNLLSDYERLLCAIFSESYEISVAHRKNHQRNHNIKPPQAVVDQIIDLWDKILPHRVLKEKSSNIQVHAPEDETSIYAASEMSDGERAIFYWVIPS